MPELCQDALYSDILDMKLDEMDDILLAHADETIIGCNH